MPMRIPWRESIPRGVDRFSWPVPYEARLPSVTKEVLPNEVERNDGRERNGLKLVRQPPDNRSKQTFSPHQRPPFERELLGFVAVYPDVKTASDLREPGDTFKGFLRRVRVMEDAMAIGEIERALTVWESKDRGLNDMEERVAAKMLVGRIYGIAEVDTDQFALFLASHVIRQGADTDAYLQHDLVSDWMLVEAEERPHRLVHNLGSGVPVGPFVPVVIDPFAGERPQDGFFTRRERLIRQRESLQLLRN